MEGSSLLKIQDPFSYFMLVAFEASGLIRFALLLTFWPLIRTLEVFGMSNASLSLTIFIALFGLKQSEIESVARAVLPKFYMEDIDMETWGVFSSFEKKVVVTKMPRVMVESFVKEHLRADEVLGTELAVNRFGFVTGFVVRDDTIRSMSDRAAALFGDEKPHVYLWNFTHHSTITKNIKTTQTFRPPRPVIFHDGRLVNRPTPSTSLIIILWTPLGITLAIIRLTLLIISPMWATLYISSIFGAKVIVKGNPPPPPSATNSGVLFVCSHRTLVDPVVLSAVLRRKVPAVTYSISRLTEIISPIPTIRLTRIRHVDAKNIENELAKGDLVVCPEGTTCREPFLLRFSALFAELTDRIVPVAMNFKAGFFHATTVRGWKALDPVFLFMNPKPVYEVTFLNRLQAEATCSSGKSPHDVANHVQKILAATLDFECTNLTRKDKYGVLVGNDGTVSYTSFLDRIRKVVRAQ